MKTKLLPLLLFAFATNAFAALDTPTEDFTDNNDGTVTHKKTGLTWQRCSVGQTWTGSSCSGTFALFTWEQMVTQSYGQWRVPRTDEFTTITEYGRYNPATNSSLFDLPNNKGFWTSSTDAANSENAWYWYSYSGFVSNGLKINTFGILLVKDGHSISSSGEYTPYTDFTDFGDGTVKHNLTGLVWQKCSLGQQWNGVSCVGDPTPLTWQQAASQAIGTNNWRLPTMSELHTIVEYKNSMPAINKNIFSNSKSDNYWSSNELAESSNGAWTVNFSSGYSCSGCAKDNTFFVRLVRGTWSAPTITTPVIQTTIDLSTTLSASTSRVKINENLTYTATVTNNGMGTANNSLLKFYLPPRNVSIVSMPSDCVTTGKSLTCSLGSLAAGANASRAIIVTYTKSGGASVSALALTDGEDTNSANNVSRVVTAIKK